MLREVLSTDIYTISLVICLVLVAVTKLLFTRRFQDLLVLLINFRYLKIYIRELKIIDVFEGLLFVNLIIGLSIFALLGINMSVTIADNDYLTLVKLAIGIGLFIYLKIVLERFVGKVLKIDTLITHYIFQKISYIIFLGLLLIPINAILIYAWPPNLINISVFGLLLLAINFIGILFFIKDNLTTLKQNWFYFILYLCALEISPYLVLYKLYTIV